MGNELRFLLLARGCTLGRNSQQYFCSSSLFLSVTDMFTSDYLPCQTIHETMLERTVMDFFRYKFAMLHACSLVGSRSAL